MFLKLMSRKIGTICFKNLVLVKSLGYLAPRLEFEIAPDPLLFQYHLANVLISFHVT